MPNNSAADWDEAAPVITDARRLGAQEIRFLRAGIAARVNKEHVELDESSAGGEHLAGSAKVYYQSTEPTKRPDATIDPPGTDLDSEDVGRLWLDSDDLSLYYWNGSAWVQISDGPTPNIAQFEKNNSAALPGLPFTQTGLTPGTYIVWLTGASDYTSNVDPITISATIEGVTRTILLSNQPDGNVPFCLVFHVTVAGDGECSLTAASGIAWLGTMSGLLTVAA